MRSPASRRSRALLLLTPLLLLACSDSSSKKKAPPAVFLEVEARANTNAPGASESFDTKLLAADGRLWVGFVDDRSGTDWLYVNRSDDGGRTWWRSDVHVPGLTDGSVDGSGRLFAASGDDLVAVFEEEEDLVANVSHDGGRTWKPDATRIDQSAAGAFDSDVPFVVFADGRFHVLWTDEEPGSRSVLHARSEDAGETWSMPVRVNTSAVGTSTCDYARLIADDNGTLYATWIEDDGAHTLRFSRSTDGGASWLAMDVVAEPPSFADLRDLWIASNGSDVYLAVLDDHDEDDRPYFLRSTDAGDTWSSEQRLDAVVDDVPCESLRFAADGALLAVAWIVKEPGPRDDLYLNVSADGGQTWLPTAMRMDQGTPGTNASDSPQLAVRGQTIAVAWEETRGGSDDVSFRYSRDGGATWSEELRTRTADPGTSADDPFPVLTDEGLWITWTDERDGEPDVYVNGGPFPAEE